MRPLNILLAVADSADDYIARESFKLLSIFGVAGGWIIAALILAPVFWKAGEERWKAYIPIYKWMVVFRLGSLPAALGLLGVVPFGLGLLSIAFGSGDSPTLVWFQLFAAFAGPAPWLLALLAALVGGSSAGTVLAVVTALTGLGFQILYGYGVYRMGVHLRHANFGWLLLSIVLPVISLIIFAADRSVWRDDSELGLDRDRIGTEVPRRGY